jgi:hypothetical protein
MRRTDELIFGSVFVRRKARKACVLSTRKADSLIPYSLGKVRVRKGASNWLGNLLFIYIGEEKSPDTCGP